MTKQIEKAGLIPYRYKDDRLEMAFMISSDPAYGGPLPQISKGHIDPEDESPAHGAIREGEEELGVRGLTVGKLSKVITKMVQGEDTKYKFHLFVADAKHLTFVEPHFETKEVVWLTFEEFMKGGRVSQQPLVGLAYSLLHGNDLIKLAADLAT